VEAAVRPGGLRRRTVLVWLVLLALVAVIGYLELADRAEQRAAAGDVENARARMLIPVPIEQVGAIELAYAAALHRFERDASGAWLYHGAHTGAEGVHAHQADPASAQRIEQAFGVLGRALTERSFELHSGNGYGVTSPNMLILVYRPNEMQPLVQYAVGDLAPDKLSRYVHAVGSKRVVTIPNYQIDNLLGLIRAVAGSPVPERR